MLASATVVAHKWDVEEETKIKTGFVALSGLPNAGKSTLLNAILGQSISIVSPKPQTTRNRIIGIHNIPGAQIVLIDTPGLVKGSHELSKRMLKGARDAVVEADVIVRVVDAKRERRLLSAEGLAFYPEGTPMIIALNKVDLVKPKELLLPFMEQLAKGEGVKAVIPISALRKDGIDELITEIVSHLSEGEKLYPDEMITDRTERFLVSELVRGMVLRKTRQEVPHAVAISVTGWRESEKGCHIEATIHVEKESQKGILIGKGASMIKSIGENARLEIGKMLACEVHLKLRVEVSTDWRTDPRALKELGYEE